MAKYDFDDDPEFLADHAPEDYGKESYYLRMLANEAAEANRLKRLELREKYKKSDWIADMLRDDAR